LRNATPSGYHFRARRRPGRAVAIWTVSEYSLTMSDSGRDRLLAAALRLFAAKGYSATSVADIQRASGLAPGSGALYKHFASKRELLEAAVTHRIDSIVAAREEFDAGQPGSVEQAVRTAGQLIWSNLNQSEDLLKVMLREPEELGDLDEKTWQVITDNAYQRFADELASSNRSGRTSIPDPEAAAAVAIASLSYAATLQALSGRLPGNVDEDRYFEAWVDQTVSVLAQHTNHRNR
jgi:AcrR family transcriptional regulator